MIFSLTSSAIPPMAKVVGFKGIERLSKPYEFDIYFSIQGQLLFDLADAVYSKATLTIELGSELPFSFSGMLASVRLLRAADGNSLFHAKLVPQLWQLTLTKHSRIWTKKTCVEVIQEVLDEAGIEYELRLNGAYPTEEMVTQYKESNLQFISRWMDREGMFYFFHQQPDGAEVLVITDNKASHVSLRSTPVRYVPQSSEDASSQQSFDNFTATHNALPASVTVIDYDYAKPMLDVSSTVDVEANAVGELAEYGGRFFSPGDAERLANIRAQDQLAHKTIFEATGAATHLMTGFKFTLDDYPLAQYNTDYVITELEHYGYEASLGPAWGSLVKHKYKDLYRVELTCILAETQYRNGIQTPWPRIDGYENAVVDGGANSQYAQIDDQGRYNLKFKFDEGTYKDGKASTYVRMAQPHGGPQEGHHFPLRKNVEVICSYLGGDPDRPVIVGVVHNAINPSVVTQNNYTKNIIRTGSLNHIEIEDLSGQMYIDVYCPIFTSTLFLGYGEWNFHLTTMGNGQIHTEINLSIDVNNEWDVDVVNNVTWKFHNQLDWTVDANVKIFYQAELDWDVTAKVAIDFMSTFDFHVVAATTVKLDATLDVKVTGNATYLFEANVKVDIMGTLDAHVVGDVTINLDANKTEHVVGTYKEDIDGDHNLHIKGHQDVSIDGPWQWIKKADEKSFTYGSTLQMFVGAKISLQIASTIDFYGGFQLSAKVGTFIDLALATKLALTVGAQLEIFAGLRMSLIAALQFNLSATNFSLTGVNMGINVIDIKFPAALTIEIVPLHLKTTGITIFI